MAELTDGITQNANQKETNIFFILVFAFINIFISQIFQLIQLFCGYSLICELSTSFFTDRILGVALSSFLTYYYIGSEYYNKHYQKWIQVKSLVKMLIYIIFMILSGLIFATIIQNSHSDNMRLKFINDGFTCIQDNKKDSIGFEKCINDTKVLLNSI